MEIIREVKLNNKSRKGTYIYVKLKKGQRGSYYKKKSWLKKQDYINAKKYGVSNKRSGAKSPEAYSKKLKSRKSIEENLSKGYSEYTIQDLTNKSPYMIRRSYQMLLQSTTNKGKQVITNKKALNLMSRKENLNKWTNHIEYKIDILGEKQEIGQISLSHKKRDLYEIKKELGEIFKKGMYIDEAKITSPTYLIMKKLTEKGYQYNHKNNDTVKTLKVKMIYRK